MAGNSADGVKISASSNATSLASVTRNAIHRNARTAVAAEGPGLAGAVVSENTMLVINAGLSATGPKTDFMASANSVVPDYGATFAFKQVDSSSFASYGNNSGYSLSDSVLSRVVAPVAALPLGVHRHARRCPRRRARH